MRLGILTTSYPRSPDDYAGRFVAELAGYFANTGDAVSVLAPAPAQSEHANVAVQPLTYSFGAPKLLFGAGAPDNLLGRASLGERASAWAQVPAFVARLAASCHQQAKAWDAVLSHWLLPCGVVAARAARGLPHLAIAHSSDVHLLTRLPGRAVLMRALSHSRSALVLTSESLREPLARAVARVDRRSARWIETAVVQRMGLLLPPALPRRPPRASGKKLQLLALGRLVPIKGVDRLLDALPGLDVELTLVGDGPEREALERRARRLGIDAHFVGVKLGPQKWQALRDADALIAPSLLLPDGRFDTAPVVPLEAMAAGLPVVASEVGGARELIDDGKTGLLVPAGNVGALRASIGRLLDDASLCRRLGQAARQRATAYDWSIVGARLREILVELYGRQTLYAALQRRRNAQGPTQAQTTDAYRDGACPSRSTGQCTERGHPKARAPKARAQKARAQKKWKKTRLKKRIKRRPPMFSEMAPAPLSTRRRDQG